VVILSFWQGMGKDGRLAMLLALAMISLSLSSADYAGAGAGRPRPGRRGPCCTFVAQSTPFFTQTTKRTGAINTAGTVGSLPRFSLAPTIRGAPLLFSDFPFPHRSTPRPQARAAGNPPDAVEAVQLSRSRQRQVSGHDRDTRAQNLTNDGRAQREACRFRQ